MKYSHDKVEGRGEGAGKLRNSEVKLRWVVVVVVVLGGMRGFSRQIDFVDLVNLDLNDQIGNRKYQDNFQKISKLP